MSLDMRHVNNGKIDLYAAIHTDTGNVNIYEKYEDIPIDIRHYADSKKESKFYGPDMARVIGGKPLREALYPNFPLCNKPDCVGTTCIAESCKHAVNGDYTKCEYFDKEWVERLK
jgi:hypothetical protein